MMKIIRTFYIGIAVVFVCYGYYTTILLANEKTLLVKDEIKVFKTYLYPSVSFCYKFKVPHRATKYANNQEKRIWMLYYRHYVEKWRNSGTLFIKRFNIDTNNHKKHKNKMNDLSLIKSLI